MILPGIVSPLRVRIILVETQFSVLNLNFRKNKNFRTDEFKLLMIIRVGHGRFGETEMTGEKSPSQVSIHNDTHKTED